MSADPVDKDLQRVTVLRFNELGLARFEAWLAVHPDCQARTRRSQIDMWFRVCDTLSERETARILAAAIKVGKITYTLPPPSGHADILTKMLLSWGVSREDRLKGEQGFITYQGIFVPRKPALEIAKAAGQIIRGPELEDLYAENMW